MRSAVDRRTKRWRRIRRQIQWASTEIHADKHADAIYRMTNRRQP